MSETLTTAERYQAARALYLQPVTLAEASKFVSIHHRHHKPSVGHKFSIGCNDGERVVGVITVGRPVSRVIQSREPYTLEVTRCCTDGTPNAPSMLYGAAWRATKALGYRRLITYTLIEEPGTSLKAAGWKALYETSGGLWDCVSRPRVDTHPVGQKTLWEAA